ncbi:MAG: hypothetical protein KTR24_07175, partial [Saprospiraceae bacterium]|nr:hypothetical protein [Saprospiraceae bacterium]
MMSSSIYWILAEGQHYFQLDMRKFLLPFLWISFGLCGTFVQAQSLDYANVQLGAMLRVDHGHAYGVGLGYHRVNRHWIYGGDVRYHREHVRKDLVDGPGAYDVIHLDAIGGLRFRLDLIVV